MQLSKQKGFTLVEIAIVLVIVGLLIGGVLKGQEMITNAKLKRIESDNAGLQAAIFSYQDRYLQLPGDDDAAVWPIRLDSVPLSTTEMEMGQLGHLAGNYCRFDEKQAIFGCAPASIWTGKWCRGTDFVPTAKCLWWQGWHSL